jgi:preprotein translocase subunit SecG
MSQQQKRQQKELKRSTKFLNFAYFIIVVAAAYYLSGLAMEKADLYDELDLGGMKLPAINKPVPEWVLQLVLAAIIFFILQFVFVFVVGLIKGGEKDAYEAYKDQWGR